MGLDVYLGERRIGKLFRAGRNGYDFAYLPEVVKEAGATTLPLSRSLPLRAEPYGPAEARAYFEGLLPTGERRKTIAHELCLDPGDGYALLAELGRDCPGAVVFLPEGEPLRSRRDDELAWLDADELEQLVTNPQRGLFDPADPRRMHFTLFGDGHPIALIRDPDGDRWAWPEPGAPSTHILEPEPDELPDLAVNSMACSTALRELAVPVAETELLTVAGRPCLVSRRSDRWGEGVDATRVHSESFLQALGIEPGSEEAANFGYAEACGLLRDVGAEESIAMLFALAFCNRLLGNEDSVYDGRAALLYTSEGPLLSPFPPLASAGAYAARRPGPGHSHQTVYDLMRSNLSRDGLAPNAIGNESEFSDSVLRAVRTAAGLGDALRSIAARAKQEGWGRPLIRRIPPNAAAGLLLRLDDLEQG